MPIFAPFAFIKEEAEAGPAPRTDIPPYDPYAFYDATNTTYSSATYAEDVVTLGANASRNFTRYNSAPDYTSGQYWTFTGANGDNFYLDSSATTSQFLSNMGGQEHTIITLNYPTQTDEEDIIGNGITAGSILLMYFLDAVTRGHDFNGSATIVADHSGVSTNAWRVASQRLSVSGGTGTLKVWGAEVSSLPASATTNTGTFSTTANGPALLTIASRVTNAGYFDGRIAQIAIYDKALTDGEVDAVHTWMKDHQGL